MRKLDYENYLKEKKIRLVKKDTPDSNELDAFMMMDYLKHKKKIAPGDIIEINSEKFIVK